MSELRIVIDAPTITAEVGAPRIHAALDSGVIRITPEPYRGAYTVTPDVSDVVLPTAERYLDRDITFEKVKTTRVRNASGGYTIIIGG